MTRLEKLLVIGALSIACWIAVGALVRWARVDEAIERHVPPVAEWPKAPGQ